MDAAPDYEQYPVCMPPREWLVYPVEPARPTEPEIPEPLWTHAETADLLALYGGMELDEIADFLGLETRDVVIRLLRVLFAAEGRLDDESLAPRSGESYSRDDLILLRSLYTDGQGLAMISDALGRSPLGAGWKLLSMGLPTIPDAVHREYFPP